MTFPLGAAFLFLFIGSFVGGMIGYTLGSYHEHRKANR